MDLTQCQDAILMQCFTLESSPPGVQRCGAQSFLGIASHRNISLVSDNGLFPSGSSQCTFSWKMYGQEFLTTSRSIIERVIYTSTPTSVSFPNSQEIFIFGNNFFASQARPHLTRTILSLILFCVQISLKIYDATHIMSDFEMHSCSSSNFFYRDSKLRVLLSTVNPITTISDLKVHNKTMISFVLESSRVLPGFKVITAQADSQVLLQSYMLLICFYLTLFLCQIFHQHLCLNISEHEHLTPKKLIKIIASYKENAKSPFIEDVQLNQRQIFTDIENVFSASASCTSQGLLLLLPAAVFFWPPAVTFFSQEQLKKYIQDVSS